MLPDHQPTRVLHKRREYKLGLGRVWTATDSEKMNDLDLDLIVSHGRAAYH
jgi:hypothetical protein